MIEWIIPAGSSAYDNRDKISAMWQKTATFLFGKRTSIAITGLEAAGKTVLYQHMTGEAHGHAYRLPERSQLIEEGTAKAAGKRLALKVVPGQDSPARRVGLDKVFADDPVVGVIHTVCNGFNDSRTQVRLDALVSSGTTTIKLYRELQQKRELEDLEEICGCIRDAHQNGRLPSWLIVAVAKVDLYADELQSAQRYYSEDGDSPFADRLRKLQNRIGTDNFAWTSRPVCSYLQDFAFNSLTVKSQVSLSQRDRLLEDFVALVEEHCGRN